jgi:hypothetical protein
MVQLAASSGELVNNVREPRVDVIRFCSESHDGRLVGFRDTGTICLAR